jgi:hypothetical protein
MIQIIVDNKETQHLDIEPIWIDDTASMVKQKLSKALKTSTEEMYLYLEATTTISTQTVYSMLVKNKKGGWGGVAGVSVDSLKSFCTNVGKSRNLKTQIDELDPAEPVPYEFFESVFAEHEYTIKIPFGVVFTMESATVLPADPFEAQRIRIGKFSVVSTNEETILSKLPSLFKNPTIYVCTVSEAINSYKHPGIGEFVSLYYPKLADKLPKKLGVDATSNSYLENIDTVHKDLLKQSEALLKTNTKYYNNVNFWNMQSDPSEIDGSDVAVGITSLTATFIASPTSVYPLPIDYIFKSFHATARMPFVRHVISKRREQMIRLYAPQEAEDDKRIPFLPRAAVNKIIVKSKKTPGLGVFVNHFGGPDIYLFLELKETGEIQIQLEAPDHHPIPLPQLDELVTVINEFVDIINDILKQTDITLTHIRNLMENASITNVDWILPFQMATAKDIFSQTKAKLGCGLFLPESVMLKEQGKREKDKGPAKTKEKAAKLKTEMSFVYTRVSNFSVDMPEELQTKLRMFYSVDTHQLYMKVTNIPQITYLQCLPKYLITFMKLLTEKDLEDEYKSISLSTYGYSKQKGEEELQAKMFEEMMEKEAKMEASAEMAEEEEDEFEKFLAARMEDIPEAPETVADTETMAKDDDEEDELGEFGLEEGEEDEDEELGDFDEDI